MQSNAAASGYYAPPVSKLLNYGDARGIPGALGDAEHWPDYLQLGLGPAQIPDLIRMATDRKLNRADSESLEVWAPVHAMRALAQLQAREAVAPLLHLLAANVDDDWLHEELPAVFGRIGPSALPTLAAYLSDESQDLYTRITVAAGIARIGVEHPEARAQCVGVLTDHLTQAAEHDRSLNAFVITSLIELRAGESAPVIRRAFEAGAVDLSVIGDWEQVQIALGLRIPAARLLQQRPLPPERAPDPFFDLLPRAPTGAGAPQGTTKATKPHKKQHKKRR